MTNKQWNRRDVLAGGAALGLSPLVGSSEERKMISRPIHSTGEPLPVIGLGTYSVFDVESSAPEIAARKEIVDLLLGEGGSLIDTSPMYNRSERVIGDVITAGTPRKPLFLATKVWIDGRQAGIEQMNRSAELMRTDVIDLMQVHNLRDTAVHMESIRAWQEEGRIRYSGITHYRASALESLEAAAREHRPQFVQINYSLGEREAGERFLPLMQDMGIAVIINRPYQAGALFRSVKDRELPPWSSDFAATWGQFFLKYIISHPAVTCVIPATSKTHHMKDNLEAGFGPLPDQKTRDRMVDFIKTL